MAIEETGSYIGDWSTTASANKPTSYPGRRSDGAGEIRQLKKIIFDTLPNLNAAATPTPAEVNVLDGATAGTVVASKAVVADANKDVTAFRHVTGTGTITGGTVTDGTASMTGGSITDGTATLASGSLTGAVNVTASGAVTGGSVTDGTATLTGGALSDGTTATTQAQTDDTTKIATTAFVNSQTDLVTGSSWSIAAGATQSVPKGLFCCSITAGDVRLEVRTGTTWRRGQSTFAAGAVISDGNNVRFYNNSGSSRTIYYIQLGLGQ